MVLPPLPVSFYLNVDPVCYQCFPDSPLPLQLGFLFPCRSKPLTIQLCFLVSVYTRGIRKVSHPRRPATMVLGLGLQLLHGPCLNNYKSLITSNLGISYHCLICLDSLLRKWQAAYVISFFFLFKRKFLQYWAISVLKHRSYTPLFFIRSSQTLPKFRGVQ